MLGRNAGNLIFDRARQPLDVDSDNICLNSGQPRARVLLLKFERPIVFHYLTVGHAYFRLFYGLRKFTVMPLGDASRRATRLPYGARPTLPWSARHDGSFHWRGRTARQIL